MKIGRSEPCISAFRVLLLSDDRYFCTYFKLQFGVSDVHSEEHLALLSPRVHDRGRHVKVVEHRLAERVELQPSTVVPDVVVALWAGRVLVPKRRDDNGAQIGQFVGRP